MLHTLFYDNREHARFDEYQIAALAIPVSLSSAEHRCKTFSAFLYISNDHL